MSLYILDTDMVTHLRRSHPSVNARASTVSPADIVTTVITVDEVLSGWYTAARQAKLPPAVELAYARLAEVVQFFTGLVILNYTQQAIARFDQLSGLKLNLKKNDMRIGAIALENGAVIVTRNVRDFGCIPGLMIEDWTLPPTGPAATGS